ncbi:MAG: hypothetical protein KDA89_11925, partial [Planctomycetaceae bacterium]|nr:hypothetical protein [Planctomycetaceae bacterium]
VARGLDAAFPNDFAAIAEAMYKAGIRNFGSLGSSLKQIGAGVTSMADALWNAIDDSNPLDVARGLDAAFPNDFAAIARAMYDVGIRNYGNLRDALFGIGAADGQVLSALRFLLL